MNLLKNSYVLGLLMIVGEMIINSVLLAAKLPHISGIILAMVAGSIYASQHKQKMPARERFKALSIYVGISVVLGIFVILTKPETFSMLGVAFTILFGTLAVYGIFMYFALGLGSWAAMRSYEKQQQAASAQTPSQPDQNRQNPIA